MVVCEYADNFWGPQNLGYHRLYGNLKRNEDVVQEFSVFVKERISVEDELLKFLNKNLNRVNTFISNNGAFVDSWRLTKSTLELWLEIQTTLVKNLFDLSREILKYYDEMVKARKRIKDQDTIDAVNLMQTTTTCLQKAKETYLQRCNEMSSLKQENTATKELVKAKAKLNRAHEEYKLYVEKYSQVRDNFENKLQKAASIFQEHDQAFLKQFKTFLCTFARSLDDAQGAVSQVTRDYRQSLEQVDIQAIMMKFINERGTGTERPPVIQWSEIDEIPNDLDIQSPSHVSNSQSAPSSSNSSAIVAALCPPETTPSVNDLLSIDSPWGNNSVKSPTDSESEETSSHHRVSVNSANNSTGGSGYVPSAVSSLFGRQKIAQWRSKKHASQSNLSTIGNESAGDFSQSYNESSIKGGGFLKRYRKSKNSETSEPKTSFSGQEDSHSVLSDDKALSSSKNPLEDIFSFGSLPSQGFIKGPEPDVDADGYTIRKAEHMGDKSKWSSNCSSSDEEDDEEFQTSKIKSLQIKPINESQSQINSSVDELRNAIGHITLQRSSTFEKDPWFPSTSNAESPFSQSLKTPMRAAFTGDDAINRKFSEFNYPSQTMPSPNFDFSQSTNMHMGIARARPRSHTPNPQTTVSSTNLSTSGPSFINRKDSMGTKDLTPFDSSLGGSFGSLANLSGWPQNDSMSAQHSSSPLSFNNDSSSGPVSRLKIPIAMGVNEYIHAWFKESTKPIVKVFGVIMCSFPGSFVSQLSNYSDPRESLKFTLKNAGQIKTVQPHKKLIPEFNAPSLPQDSLTFTLNKQALANWIFEQQQQKSGATEFYNVDLVRYELDESFEAPLRINSYWKLESNQTDLRIDYSLNTSDKTLTTPLINIAFDTCVNGKVDSYTSDPLAKWNEQNNTLSFSLTELTRHGGSTGSLKARLKLNEGPSSVSDTIISFQTSNTTASSVNLQLDSETAYQLSLVRKKVVSGKYFCKPEVRS